MNNEKTKSFRLCAKSPESGDDIKAYGVGMDVHKNHVNVCISAQLRTDEIVTVKSHVFQNSPRGLDEMVGFLRKIQPIRCYLMECTGVYHLPVYYRLQKAFPNQRERIVAMNPLMLHRRTGDLGVHADKTDAIGLANFSHYTKLIVPSYIGSMDFFRLRELMRLYHRNKIQITRTLNRIRGLLDGENFKFPLDLKNEWGLHLLDRFISKDWPFHEAFEAVITARKNAGRGFKMFEKRRNFVKEYENFTFTSTSRFILQMHLSNLLYLQGEGATYLLKAENLILKDPELRITYKHLMAIPSIGSLAALTLLVELGNYYRFRSRQAFVKFCGVVPLIDNSGESEWRGRLNRHTNKHIRKVLTQSAGILINVSSKTNDLARYAHLQFKVKGLPYKKAMLKVANKLAKVVYNILILGINYDPNYEYIRKRERKITESLAKRNSLLETHRTRALRRDIQDFLVTNYDFLNSTSKYHLKAGFRRVLNKARYLDRLGPSDE